MNNMENHNENSPVNSSAVDELWEDLHLLAGKDRYLVIASHGFIELVTNLLICDTLKSSKKIIEGTRDYPQSVKNTILYEMDLINENLYFLLEIFRKLRNKAVHDRDNVISFDDILSQLTGKLGSDFIKHWNIYDIASFCKYVTGAFWNHYINVYSIKRNGSQIR